MSFPTKTWQHIQKQRPRPPTAKSPFSRGWVNDGPYLQYAVSWKRGCGGKVAPSDVLSRERPIRRNL